MGNYNHRNFTSSLIKTTPTGENVQIMSTENATPAQAPKVYTSEKLTELSAKRAELLTAIRNEQDEDKAFELNQELFGIGQQIKAENARLKAEDLKAEIEAKRAAKISELSKLVQLGITNDKVAADKKATDEDKAAAKLAYDTQFDVIANQILGSVPKAPAAAKKSGEPKAGAQKAQIVEWYKGYRAEGHDHTTSMKMVIESNGVSRGSAWGPIDEYRKSIGEKA